MAISNLDRGDHTEVIELDYDPKTVTYEDLLDMFWANHEYGLTKKIKRQVNFYVISITILKALRVE